VVVEEGAAAAVVVFQQAAAGLRATPWQLGWLSLGWCRLQHLLLLPRMRALELVVGGVLL
jgi:hypothetical protein